MCCWRRWRREGLRNEKTTGEERSASDCLSLGNQRDEIRNTPEPLTLRRLVAGLQRLRHDQLHFMRPHLLSLGGRNSRFDRDKGLGGNLVRLGQHLPPSLFAHRLGRQHRQSADRKTRVDIGRLSGKDEIRLVASFGSARMGTSQAVTIKQRREMMREGQARWPSNMSYCFSVAEFSAKIDCAKENAFSQRRCDFESPRHPKKIVKPHQPKGIWPLFRQG